MKIDVILSVCGKQQYIDQEPDKIELVTEGVLEQVDDGWRLVYEESELTGLAGVTTEFLVQPSKISLTRTGPLNSQMIFQEGVFHESLYQMEFGALMITVCASKVSYEISQQGGYIDLVYGIEVEQSAAGVIEYHLDIKAKA